MLTKASLLKNTGLPLLMTMLTLPLAVMTGRLDPCLRETAVGQTRRIDIAPAVVIGVVVVEVTYSSTAVHLTGKRHNPNLPWNIQASALQYCSMESLVCGQKGIVI